MSAKPKEKPLTLQEVQNKARFGHKDWLYWEGKDGKPKATRRSADAIKAMLLETGTKGWWCLVMANNGTPCKGFWAMGINIWAQSKRGWA